MVETIFRKAREAALQGASRLTPGAMAVVGMSDARMRHMLNNIGSHVSTYLEVGSYHGSTLVAAACRNPRLWALGIDNFSHCHPELNAGGGPREQLPVNLRRHAPHARYIEAHFRQVDPARLPVLDCFFYDGSKDPGAATEALVHFAPRFGPECLLLVDDWNWADLRRDVYTALDAVEDLVEVVSSTELPDTWNNVGVFVLRQQDGGPV